MKNMKELNKEEVYIINGGSEFTEKLVYYSLFGVAWVARLMPDGPGTHTGSSGGLSRFGE